ncbi:histidine kinase [Jiulongibacter sediminis]|jgi:sensor histidine kinase YesM|uniref:histidine kinase n=1 Tax=Jiulongibacter sediminis TaxID=1605367 RepID=UPI0026EFF81D|nr:histidine kinase [Jiulongibacter sediminis]
MNNKPLHSKTIDGHNLSEVRVKTGWGNIECFALENDEYKVEVYAQKLSFLTLFEWQRMSATEFADLGFRIYREDDLLIIRSDAMEGNLLGQLLQFKRVHFRLFLPRQCSVDVQNQIGDIRITGLTGNHRYKSRFGSIYLNNIKGRISSGNKNYGRKIEINHCEGDLKLSSGGSNLNILHCSGNMDFNTDGGNIRILNYQGILNCRTKGGNVKVESFVGELKAASWGGNIKVEHLNGDVTANTMGGNVSLKARRIENYAWLQTSGGNIRFEFFENQRFDLSAKASRVKASGNFTFHGSQSRTKWNGEVNGGGPDVRLKTAGGNVSFSGVPGLIDQSQNITYQTKTEIPPIKARPTRPVTEDKPKIVQTARPKSSSQRQETSVPKLKSSSKIWENTPVIGQALLALVIVTLLTYGFNTITYFSSQMLAENGTKTENVAIFYLNLINGVLAFTALWIFISLLNHKIRKAWIKYLVLTVMTIFFYMLGHGILQSIPESAVHGRGLVYHYKWLTSRPQEQEPIFLALLFLFVPVLANISFFSYWNRSRNMSERLDQQQLQLLNLEKLKTKAQLNALEARINPHFLYNSLNSIAGLIHENADQAEDMTIELSKLFRATTGRKNESYHGIGEEIELVKSYLAIEKMRFGERLSYEINVEPQLKEHKIPRFLLQPLVENAIKHGISKIASNGEIKIDIKSIEDKINITIHDNGPDFGEAMSGGYGLKSVQDKLDLIYEGKASLDISNTPVKQLTILIDKNHAL